MKLSIIIPVYNEEKTIADVIRHVFEVKLPGVEKEIIVINDGSTDKTAEKVNQIKGDFKGLIFISQQKNQGKGAAVKVGIEQATGDYILIQDADFEYNPKEIPKLLSPVLQGNAKVVYGTRLKRPPNLTRDERTIRFFIHYMGNKFLSLMTTVLYGQIITDMETGYKLFPKNGLEKMNLHAKSFDFEPEITAKLLKKGYKIVEVPISTNPRGYKQGKKLNTVKDGIIAFWSLLKFRILN